MRALLWIASLGVLCLSPATVRAGLVFDLDGKIDARRLDAAEVGDDHLTVTIRGRSQTVQVPDGVGASLMAWARADTGGPLVFSIDGSLVLSSGHNYAPPSVPRDLAIVLLRYDTYAHSVACGATLRSGPDSHPLIQAAGRDMLPDRVHVALLDPETRTPEASPYRRLPERFVHVPACVGELTLSATPGTDGRPVAIQPRSWIHIVTHQWYRNVDVASEADKWIARLPYEPLKHDLEARWPAYRAAFQPLDSLSSIVEAMALLRAIKRDAPSVFRELERQAPARRPMFDRGLDSLEGHDLDRRAWLRWSYAWLGERIETPSQANLALGLAAAGDHRMLDVEGIEVVAARDPIIAAKLQLARLLFRRDQPPSLDRLTEDSHRMFAMLARVPQSFRLRATALSLIEFRADSLRRRLRHRAETLESGGATTNELDDEPGSGLDNEPGDDPGSSLDSELAAQQTALAEDFLGRAESACRSRTHDLFTWEDLSQDVYSVGLLERFLSHGRHLSPRFAAAVACIHVHRALAPQQGRELAYRHGHYRFLRYLTALTDDAPTRAQILRYRRALAVTMNLHDSDLELPVQQQ